MKYDYVFVSFTAIVYSIILSLLLLLVGVDFAFSFNFFMIVGLLILCIYNHLLQRQQLTTNAKWKGDRFYKYGKEKID